jgi:hypothetical protein
MQTPHLVQQQLVLEMPGKYHHHLKTLMSNSELALNLFIVKTSTLGHQ